MQRGLDRETHRPGLLRLLWLWLLPLAALIAISPLLVRGCSCGHDLVFHMQSWLDAAEQLRHGTLYPRWAFHPAWNAGEPRFTFYPPLSWMLGALLTLIFPAAAAPTIFVWIALTGAGLSMYYLVSRLGGASLGPSTAAFAAALYLANPYMLFNAFERSALGELLAAAWIPLLLLAVLRPRPSIPGVALPMALLWLTNAPAAVMGSYLLAFVAALRLIAALAARNRQIALPEQSRAAQSYAPTFIGGAALGLALPAFYVVPAAFERRYVQVAMAVIPNLRFQDNFLFGRTDYEPHNAVTHTVSVLAVVLLLVTAAILSALLILRARSVRPGEPGKSTEPQAGPAAAYSVPLAILTLVIAFLMVPLSTPVWQHVPELAFLQFPWRLLTILAAVLGLAVALLLAGLEARRSSNDSSTLPIAVRTVRAPVLAAQILATLLCPLALSWVCFHLYAQGCDPNDRPGAVAALLRTHHGADPTDEYTPTDADNDVLRTDNPGYWLAPDPQAFAPGTIPNPNATNPDYDRPTPIDQTVSAPAPLHLSLTLPQPEDLILNLRDYPEWRLTDNGREPAHIERDDGLLAVALPAGASHVEITWRRTPDQELGDALSAGGLVALALTFLWRRRRVRRPLA
jgi:hypothetical protein